MSLEFDQYIVAEVFKILKTPPLDMLTSALEATRAQDRTRRSWMEAEPAQDTFFELLV